MRSSQLLVAVVLCVTPVFSMDLMLDPYRVPDLCARVSKAPELLRPFERIHIIVFSNGQLAGPGQCQPFGNLTDAPALQLTRLVHAQGKSVAWGFDLLRWERPGCARIQMRQRVPDWLEVDASNRLLTSEEAAFASPWEPRVVASLRNMLDIVSQWEPQPEAVDLCCRLSAGTTIGYSQQAREAAIRAVQIDPVDLADSGVGGDLRDVWAQWREDTLTALVTDLSRRYHATQPAVALFGWSSGTFLNAPMSVRLVAGDYGPRLVKERVVQGLLLDAQWASLPGMWRFAKQAVPANAAEPRLVRAIVLTRDGDNRPSFAETVAALTKQGADLDDIVAYPLQTRDLDLVNATSGNHAAPAVPPEGAQR